LANATTVLIWTKVIFDCLGILMMVVSLLAWFWFLEFLSEFVM